MLSLGLLTVSNYMFRSIRYALAQHTHQSTSICPIKQLSKNKLHDLIECPIIQEYMARLFLSLYMLQFFFSNLAIQVLYYLPVISYSVVQFLELCTHCLQAITAGLATLGRIGKVCCEYITRLITCCPLNVLLEPRADLLLLIQGNSYTASKVPPQPIEIWAYEV